MKRIKCPKCDSYLTFDETQYAEGQTLVFECTECHKQFGIRLGTTRLHATRKDERRDAPADGAAPTTALFDSHTPQDEDCGHLLVLENVFHYRQTLPLQMGDNVIGRYVRGSRINTPIETVDPSVDTTHCIINVRRNRRGQLIYTLRDATPDGTGTFVGNTILGVGERQRIDHGAIITIGATTMILNAAGCHDEETTAEERRR
ncbi:MAG: FHA domain-containing protein [Bacteroidaceae bacterium]|nr:FHA domain-containing protein [Bacteroidaceae bacterium]